MANHKHSLLQVLFIALIFVLAACTTSPDLAIQNTPILETDTPVPTLADTPYPESSTTESDTFSTPYPDTERIATAVPSPTPVVALWVAEYVPEEIAAYIADSSRMNLTSNSQIATLILDVASNGDGEDLVAQWIYALVAPFPTIPDGVTPADLHDAWGGNLGTGPFAGIPLLVDRETYGVFSALWGTPPTEAVKIIPPDELLQTAWGDQPSWGIIPFEQLDPQWKVVQMDGVSPIQKDFDPEVYPLTVGFALHGDAPEITPIRNHDPEKMTDLMLTGVTAMVRGTALTMERKGITYPGEDIAPLTTQVDYMHVSNEIPFTPDCPFPKLYQEKLVFCSDPRYLELMEYIGTDFVEVSGDHFGDHGTEGTLFTLDLYDEVGLPYYGGGRDLEDGRQPLLIEHHGNKIAILGCNAKGSDYYAPADEDTPGAVPCDFDWMESEIARLKADGYLVIVTLQHIEYYSYVAQPDLVRDFGRMAAAGAMIVSGSQAHQAHGMAFTDGAFIHYGLGNLFFDQYLYCENADCDYGFMDRHIIYDGGHISTELIPIRFIDMARPRPMTVQEKTWFLDLIFEASGWQSR
jgi:poly-gamma-glutamate synthesis protein (capsule biosynthesis protein)